MADEVRTARLIVTKRCERSCSYCCNEHPNVKETMRTLQDVRDLRGFDEVLVTGGEPSLVPSKTINILEILRKHVPDAKLYLYSARYAAVIAGAVRRNLVDGVTYTLHDDATGEDVGRFLNMQRVAGWGGGDGRTFRLNLGSGIQRKVPITPSAWERIKIKHWKAPGECRVPEGTLFCLEE
jgi:hypothetical protein